MAAAFGQDIHNIAGRLEEIAGSQATRAAQAAAQAAGEQSVRDAYGHTITKAKTVLHPPFLVAMMLYPSTIALSLQARSGKFALLIPTPAVPGTPPDQMGLTGSNNQWTTVDVLSTLLTVVSFVTVTVLHTYILMHLRIRGPLGAVKVVSSLAWVPTIAFWGATTTYFLAYMSMSRYGIGVFDLVFTCVCSGILLLATFILLAVPLPHHKVVKARNAQAGDVAV